MRARIANARLPLLLVAPSYALHEGAVLGGVEVAGARTGKQRVGVLFW